MQDPNAVPLPFLVRDMLRFEGAAAFDLELTYHSMVAVRLEITGMTREGPFRYNLTTNTTGLATTAIFALPDIPITVNVRISDATPVPNYIYAMLYLRVNSTKNTLLCQGNLGGSYGISFPFDVKPAPLQMRGKSHAVLGSDPAANTEASIAVPDGQYWLLRSIRGTLVTDGNAATRSVTLSITHRNGEIIECPMGTTQAASLSYKYNWFVGAASVFGATSLRMTAPIPVDLLLPPGSTLDTVTTNKQATDNWGPLSALVEIFFSELP